KREQARRVRGDDAGAIPDLPSTHGEGERVIRIGGDDVGRWVLRLTGRGSQRQAAPVRYVQPGAHEAEVRHQGVQRILERKLALAGSCELAAESVQARDQLVLAARFLEQRGVFELDG